MFGQDYDKNHGMDNKDFPEWVGRKMEDTFHSFCHPLHHNSNIICSNKQKLIDKYKDRNILILGGGGSTLKYLETSVYNKTYAMKRPNDELLWTMNNFFQSSELARQSFSLISLGPEVNILDDYLNEYLNFHGSDVGIELHQKWSRESKDSQIVKEVNEWFEPNKFCFQTRYFSILGSGARLVILACELGAKSVSFTGFDGPQAIWAADHAFEKGKNFMTYRAQGYPQDQVIKMFKDEYNWFWNYVKITYPNIRITALTDPNNYHGILSSSY